MLQPKSAARSAELQCITAELDGIGPALLLRIAGDKGPQYLFNVPEGFSRLVLEHKIRPDSKLKAVLALQQPSIALAGLAGLIMRLKQDGHEKVELIGPPGSLAAVTSLQHFIGWQHPKVLASEVDPALCKEVYQDEYISILPLAGSPLCWPAPSWISHQHSCEVQQTRKLKQSVETAGSRSIGEAKHRDMKLKSRSSSSSSSMGAAMSEEDTAWERASSDQSRAKVATEVPAEMSCFEQLDNILSSGGAASCRHRALSVLKGSTADPNSLFPNPARSSAPEPAGSQAADMLTLISSPVPSIPQHSPQGYQQQQDCPVRLPCGQNAMEGWAQVARCRNPVFTKPSALSKLPGRSRDHNQVWGYAVWLRERDEIFLVVQCQSVNALPRMQAHPVFGLLAASPIRVSMILHFTLPWVTKCSSYQKWADKLPGKQVLLNSSEFGLAASARTAARLHSLAPAIFPLPHALQLPGAASKDKSSSLVHARMLAKFILTDNGVVVDETDCPKALDPGKLQAEILQERPELAGHIAALKQTKLWEPVSLPRPPKLALPAFPPPVRQRPLSQHQETKPPSSPRLQHVGVQGIPFSHTITTHGQQHLSAPRAARSEPVGGQLAVQQGTLPASAWCPPAHVSGVAVGQFAQVLHFGKPIGVVQLTLHGWAGPAELMSAFAPLGASCQPGFLASNMGNIHNGGQRHVAEASNAPGIQPQSEIGVSYEQPAHPDRHAMHEGADLGRKAKRQKLRSSHQHRAGGGEQPLPTWRAEDIELESDDDEIVKTEGLPTEALSSMGAALAAANCHVASKLKDQLLPGDRTQLTFLGTGCAEPSKYRGASAIHLQLDWGHGLLMDAGEGAYGQMVRCYGKQGAREQVAQLAAVFISHKHADHMLGLPGILHARPASSPPLLVIGPCAARDWLAKINLQARLRYNFVLCSWCADKQARPQLSWLAEALGLRLVRTLPVEHCTDAWAIVLEHLSGWSLCFSGDTRPCTSLIHAARDCTVLIHEATFEPDMVDKAVERRHSTSSEALQVAVQAGAYRTILTHFSQRYSKLPPGIEGPAADKAAVAFDGMKVPLACLPELPLLLPVLRAAFNDLEQSADHASEAEGIAAFGFETKQQQGEGEAIKLQTAAALPTPPDQIKRATHIRFDE